MEADLSKEDNIIYTSHSLDLAGLCWRPEIGDEIALRANYESVSILFDPQGMTPTELRTEYLWLPKVEQLVEQFEARQALIEHVGINDTLCYEAVIKSSMGLIEVKAQSIRLAFGKALWELLTGSQSSHLQ